MGTCSLNMVGETPLVLASQAIATITTNLWVGSSLYISLTEIPARRSLATVEAKLKNWQTIWPLAGRQIGILGGFSLACQLGCSSWSYVLDSRPNPPDQSSAQRRNKCFEERRVSCGIIVGEVGSIASCKNFRRAGLYGLLDRLLDEEGSHCLKNDQFCMKKGNLVLKMMIDYTPSASGQA